MPNALTDDFQTIFTNRVPLIDVRAPVEFVRGGVPGAVNLPIMVDDERHAVGCAYADKGPDAARALGHRLVSGAIRDERVGAWVDFVNRHPECAIYCFRGGLRSTIAQQWLAEAGHRIPRVDGGYKRMRQWLINELESRVNRKPVYVVGGRTGTAKTRLIHALDTAVDLEGRAHHRGSAFGRWPEGQPSQIDFEHALALDFMRVQADGWEGVVVEDEGNNVGSLSVPAVLFDAMGSAPLALVESSLDDRVSETVNGYIRETLSAWAPHATESASAFELFANGLRESLHRIRKRLGLERHARLDTMLAEALDRHERHGDVSAHREWIAELLTDYYDPMYDYQLASKESRIAFRGSRDDVTDWLNQKTAPR